MKWLSSVIASICLYITMSKNKRKNKNKDRKVGEVLSGELDVVGKDEVSINLEGRPPFSVNARFTEDASYPIPCNPGSVDRLDFGIVVCEGRTTLVIEWCVASQRTIIWEVCY